MENKLKHTPGPWMINDNDRSFGRSVRDSDGNMIAVPSDQKPHEEIESLANAKLIAAAPELLDGVHALLAVINEMKDGVQGQDAEWNDCIALAQEAIKKATE